MMNPETLIRSLKGFEVLCWIAAFAGLLIAFLSHPAVADWGRYYFAVVYMALLPATIALNCKALRYLVSNARKVES